MFPEPYLHLRYTRSVEFDWDEANEDHIARHGIESAEAEEAATDPDRVAAPAYRSQRGEPRQGVTGKTEDGRILTLILTRRGALFRVVTAREATDSERTAYTDSALFRNTRNCTGCSSMPQNPYLFLLPLVGLIPNTERNQSE